MGSEGLRTRSLLRTAHMAVTTANISQLSGIHYHTTTITEYALKNQCRMTKHIFLMIQTDIDLKQFHDSQQPNTQTGTSLSWLQGLYL